VHRLRSVEVNRCITDCPEQLSDVLLKVSSKPRGRKTRAKDRRALLVTPATVQNTCGFALVLDGVSWNQRLSTRNRFEGKALFIVNPIRRYLAEANVLKKLSEFQVGR
jgi:hypothetical protein